MKSPLPIVFGDFETRAAIDLRQCGVDVYSKDPRTEVLCFGFAIGDGPVKILKPGDVEVFRLIEAGATFVAHNAPFELAIWNNVCVPKMGWPALKPEQCDCTMARAYAMSLPGSLDGAAAASGIGKQKDLQGHRVMMQLSQPRELDEKTGAVIWWDDAEKIKRLHAYCLQDVEVERELYKRLLPLSPSEKALWVLDQKINNRGIGVDMRAVENAIKIIETEKVRLDEQMKKVTGNQVATCNASSQLKNWIKSKGFEVDSIAKAALTEMLADKKIPVEIKEALYLRQEAAKSSTAKLTSMFFGATKEDGRVRNTMQYHGANTGRWAGRRIQPQNLPRPTMLQQNINEAIEIISSKKTKDATELLDLLYGAPTSVISNCLRSFLVPAPKKDFIGADFSSIEARMLAWLAGEEQVLEIFRTHGKIYEYAAALIYGIPMEKVTKDQRQIGKVSELALGYQGGKGAFQMMAKAYGIKVTDEQAEGIKNAWRANRQKTVRFWYMLENAAIRAVLEPGSTTAAGAPGREIRYHKKGSFLWCRLPSSRVICYPYPKIKPFLTPWGAAKDGLVYMAESSLSRKFEEQKVYGGLLCENVTQAASRDILAEAIVRLEKHNYPVVLHAHDEALAEVLEGFGSIDDMTKIMSEVPRWAEGLPIRAEGFRSRRYQK